MHLKIALVIFPIFPNAFRGSKQDMQATAAAAQPNAEYVGDEQAILESEQQYP